MAKHTKDYLDQVIEERLATDPQFAAAWPATEVVLELIELRLKLGLSQGDVAERMGTERARVTELEKSPTKVSFGRLTQYASALGASLKVQQPTVLMVREQTGPGRRVSSSRIATKKSSKKA